MVVDLKVSMDYILGFLVAEEVIPHGGGTGLN